MFRLLSSIGMLGVLLLLILQARREETWRWLTGEGKRAESAIAAPVSPEVYPAETYAKQFVTDDKTLGTDQDSEEQEGAGEEFLAMSDKTLSIQPEEMPAYWRLFGWAERQSLKDMRKRAAKRPIYHQFAELSDQQRGKLFEIKLKVRRVLSFLAPENPAGVKKVYEIWGATDESQAWPYVVLTSELPKGMPEGTSVSEDAYFSGYFLKLQGYHEGGAKPNAPPLSAPLLIGKVAWLPTVKVAVNPPAPTWVIWVGLAICGMIGVRLFVFLLRWKSTTRGDRPVFERSKANAGEVPDVQALVQSASGEPRRTENEWDHFHANGAASPSNYSSPSDN